MFRMNDFGTRLMMLVVLFFVGFALFGLMVSRSFEKVRVNGELYQEIAQRKDIVADVLPPPLYIIESYLAARMMQSESDQQRLEELQSRLRSLRAGYNSAHDRWARELKPSELQRLLVQGAHETATAFFQELDRNFLPALASGDASNAQQALLRLDQSYRVHRESIDNVVKLAQAESAETEARAKRAVESQTFWFMLIGGVLLLIVALLGLVAMQMLRKLRGRIDLASEVASKIAAGDLTTEIPNTEDSDETANLLRAIQKMNDNLRALVTRAKQSSIELMSTATEYAATSREQEATVQGFGASTSQIAAATKQISATSAELLSTMNSVNVVAVNTATMAEQGQNGLKNLDRTMDKLASTASTMTSRLAVIRQEASEITSVVTAISKVADQTNLLSINAAIEAEKAGEQGLGFLVLAREIRRLADQTAVASLDIEQMIKQMQSAVSAGVMEIDRFAEEVRLGVGGVADVGEQFRNIIVHVKSLSERFDAVNAGMNAQSQGARQIGDSMAQLTEGARQTTISIREFNGATENLRDAVAALKGEIAQFNVGD